MTGWDEEVLNCFVRGTWHWRIAEHLVCLKQRILYRLLVGRNPLVILASGSTSWVNCYRETN